MAVDIQVGTEGKSTAEQNTARTTAVGGSSGMEVVAIQTGSSGRQCVFESVGRILEVGCVEAGYAEVGRN